MNKYEAIGRYTEAKQAFDQQLLCRKQATGDLARYMKQTIDSHDKQLDMETIRVQLDAIEQHQIACINAAAAANAVAQQAEQQPLVFDTP